MPTLFVFVCPDISVHPRHELNPSYYQLYFYLFLFKICQIPYNYSTFDDRKNLEHANIHCGSSVPTMFALIDSVLLRIEIVIFSI